MQNFGPVHIEKNIEHAAIFDALRDTSKEYFDK